MTSATFTRVGQESPQDRYDRRHYTQVVPLTATAACIAGAVASWFLGFKGWVTWCWLLAGPLAGGLSFSVGGVLIEFYLNSTLPPLGTRLVQNAACGAAAGAIAGIVLASWFRFVRRE